VISCPNPGLIRTAFGFFSGFLSESGAYSDCFRVSQWVPVRIRGLFGLLSGFSVGSCPNPGLIRTAFGFLSGFLSESGAYSDCFWVFQWVPVRIRGLFGLLLDFSVGSCPNPGLIRTAFGGFSVISCPNPGLIRTAFGFFSGFLSESGPYSDCFWVFQWVPVRIQGLFGLLSGFSVGSCPNPGLIRTAFGGFSVISCPNPGLIRTAFGFLSDFLSEYQVYSDNFLTPPNSKGSYPNPEPIIQTAFEKELIYTKTTFKKQRP
jgi:hypothetical protein